MRVSIPGHHTHTSFFAFEAHRIVPQLSSPAYLTYQLPDLPYLDCPVPVLSCQPSAHAFCATTRVLAFHSYIAPLVASSTDRFMSWSHPLLQQLLLPPLEQCYPIQTRSLALPASDIFEPSNIHSCPQLIGLFASC